jgi:hypothetical protein
MDLANRLSESQKSQRVAETPERAKKNKLYFEPKGTCKMFSFVSDVVGKVSKWIQWKRSPFYLYLSEPQIGSQVKRQPLSLSASLPAALDAAAAAAAAAGKNLRPQKLPRTPFLMIAPQPSHPHAAPLTRAKSSNPSLPLSTRHRARRLFALPHAE